MHVMVSNQTKDKTNNVKSLIVKVQYEVKIM